MNAETRGNDNEWKGVDGMILKEAALTQRIMDTFYAVYNELGHGFLESVYESALCLALTQAGLRVERQKPIQVWFRGEVVGEFKTDIVVEGRVIVETKAAKSLDSAHEAQLLNYLRATDIEVGLLLNFGERPEVRRLVYDNSRKLRPTQMDIETAKKDGRG